MIDTFVKLNVVKIIPFLNPYLPEFFDPQIPKMCDPILVTLLKMQPHYSKSSRENANPPAHPH